MRERIKEVLNESENHSGEVIDGILKIVEEVQEDSFHEGYDNGWAGGYDDGYAQGCFDITSGEIL